MPYFSCPECGLTVQSAAGRFAARSCPKCSVPLVGSDQMYTPDRGLTAISRRLRAGPKAAQTARRALDTLCWRLDPAQLHVAALLTTELIANAIQHAGIGDRGHIRLEAALTEKQIRVAVGDQGTGFVPAPRAAGAPLDSHWGLHLVDQLADRWGVVAEPETLVWFELDTPVPAQTGDSPPERARDCHPALTARHQ
jgi:anti-sigma regulatory factor (Ser/Thr protein kinase)